MMIFKLIALALIPLYTMCQDELDSTLANDALKEDLSLPKPKLTPLISLQKLIAKPGTLYGYILTKSTDPGKEYSIIKTDSAEGKFWINDHLGSPITIVSFISKDNSFTKVQVEDIFWSKAEADELKKKYGTRIWNMIIERDIRIGWSEDLCLLSWGPPKKINTTTTSFGTNEQWVYHGRNLYFDNGKLTAIQRY